jgi:hypothetical protein
MSEVNNYRVSNNHYQEGPVYEEHYHTAEDHRSPISNANHNYSPSTSHSRATGNNSRIALNLSQTQGSNTALLLVAGLFAVGGVAVLGVALLAAATVIAIAGAVVARGGGLLYYRTVTAPYRYRLQQQAVQQQHELLMTALDIAREQHRQHHSLLMTQQQLALPAPSDDNLLIIEEPTYATSQSQASASHRAYRAR